MAQRPSGGSKTRSRSEKQRSGSRAPASASKAKKLTTKSAPKPAAKTAKKTVSKPATKKAAAKKAPTKSAQKKPAKSTAKKAAKTPVVKKAAAKKAPAKKAAKKSLPQKPPAKKAANKAAKKAPAKKAAKKAPPQKAQAKKAAPQAATKASAKPVAGTQVATAAGTGKKAEPQRRVKPLKQAATSAPRPSGRGRKPLTPAERDEMKGVLLGERGRLEREIASAVEDLNELLRDSGDGSGDDQADAGSKTFEREHEMSVANNSRDLLVQVEHALRRIADGTYGTCESCGLPIGKMRLEAFPRATLCVDCKQREERR